MLMVLNAMNRVLLGQSAHAILEKQKLRMKHHYPALLTFTSLLILSSIGKGQESFNKKYNVPAQIGSVPLKKDTLYRFADLEDKDKKPLCARFPMGSTITVNEEWLTSDGKITGMRTKTVDRAFFDSLKVKKEIPANFQKRTKAFVKFEEDKVLVNPLLIKIRKNAPGTAADSFIRRPLASYTLLDRESIRLSFTEFTVSALTLPFKYRFKKDDIGLKEEFSAGANANLVIGYSWGKTKFHHRKKVGNISNTWKITVAALAGASTVTLNAGNTSLAEEPLSGDTEITKGLGSLGYGVTYSFNKINLGIFSGRDYSVGNNASKWDYNKRPWLGLAFGYSLFSL